MKYRFFVIEETTKAGLVVLAKTQRELGEIIFFKTKGEAKNWKNVLTKARGAISSFKIIVLEGE